MLNKLLVLLRNYDFLGPRDISQLYSISKFKTFKKGELIIKEGELNYSVVFVLKGLLKIYVTDENGEDRTMLFVPKKKNAAAYSSIFRNAPSDQNISAIEDSIVAMVDMREFEKLAKKNSSLLFYQNRILKEVLAYTVDQLKSHVLLTPEQRYINFCKEFPKLEQRVTQKDLATYLGITATSLSRMRSRLT